jgi:post-segregation antitoxin (ccd killing protein)
MTKVKLTLTVDDQLIARARMFGVNLSNLLEETLRNSNDEGIALRRRRSSADLSAPIWKKGKKKEYLIISLHLFI